MKMIKIVPLLLMVAMLAGCGNFRIFSRHHQHRYGTDQNKERIAELESRIGTLEQRLGLTAENPQTAPACAPDAAKDTETPTR